MTTAYTDASAAPSTDETPEVTVVKQTVKVSLLGSDDVVVTVEGTGNSVEDVLRAAARLLDVQLDTSRVGVVRNGAAAQLDDEVQPDDRVTAAPRVSNGLGTCWPRVA